MNNVTSRSGQSDPRATSTSLAVPDLRLVSIEHPCIVKDFNNGLRSLGGEQQIKHILEDDKDDDGRSRKVARGETSRPVVAVSLRPHDPLAKKIEASPITTHGLLVKATLPKWTGRKRKRGTEGPFIAADTNQPRQCISAPDLIRRMRDNVGNYKVEAVGRSEISHRFEALPDLHARDRDVPVMLELRQHAMTANYDVLKKFKIDLTPGVAGITALPRPTNFIPPDLDVDDTLEVDQTPQQAAVRETPRETTQAKYKYKPDAEVPDALKPIVDALDQFFQNRPIVTRLYLQHAFPDTLPFRLDNAVTWVATKTKQGPWKGCYVKRALDPTTDPQYRLYQIIAIKLPQSIKNKDDFESHIFDGKTKTKARSFQYVDITDSSISSIVNTSNYRAREEGHGGPHLGWYHNGTIAKVRVLMGDKLKRMHNGTPLLDERAYAAVATLPDKVDEGTVCEIDDSVHGSEAKTLGTMVRKEALRLLWVSGEQDSGKKCDVTREGGGAGDEADEGNISEDDEDDFAIDPALMGDEHQRAERFGNSLAAGVN